jgi:hypothetical protein
MKGSKMAKGFKKEQENNVVFIGQSESTSWGIALRRSTSLEESFKKLKEPELFEDAMALRRKAAQRYDELMAAELKSQQK